ncbi:MAG: S-layer homology domain-containing protein [Oscillospiraceae bacterium]|nr:S-layer homology domain-containing protein [Oscillospiraceae bacterium]
MSTESKRAAGRRSFICALLTFAMILGLSAAMPIAAGAENTAAGAGTVADAGAATRSMSNFVMTRYYSHDKYTDVDENMWYGTKNFNTIADVYQYELMSGDSPTTFNPTGNITIAEAITIAARVHSIYTTGHKLELAPIPDAPWFQGYVNYAIDNGIISSGVFDDYDRAASRAEMAYIFAYALHEATYKDRYDVNWPPDVDESTPYYNEIMKLYSTGIVGGDEGTWAFRHADNITRAETAAIIIRLAVDNKRLGYDYYYPGFTS